ncbi:MAG: trehalose-phosphatase [Thermoanaerobaculia bacterium]
MNHAIELLLASDFDGTLADIRDRPEDVVIRDEARELLENASNRDGVSVAFLSGRDLEDLTLRTAGIHAWRSGSHGLDVADPEGRILRSGKPLTVRPPDEWMRQVGECGLTLEKKKYGVAVHWRTAEGVNRRHPLVGEFARWAEANGLHPIEGRCVLEASVPGFTKIDALRFLAEESRASRVVYAGDDITDFAALEWAAARGHGFFVRSLERKELPPPGVEPVGSTVELLAKFEEVLREAGSPSL